MSNEKKTLSAMSGIVLIVLAALNLYDHFVLTPLSRETFAISPLSVFNRSFGQPVFWLCAGVLVILIFVRGRNQPGYSRSALWLGAALCVVYAVLAVVQIAAPGAVQPLYILSLWMNSNAPVFLLPGVLIGIGISD